MSTLLDISNYPDLDAPPRVSLGPGPSLVHPKVLLAMATPLSVTSILTFLKSWIASRTSCVTSSRQRTRLPSLYLVPAALQWKPRWLTWWNLATPCWLHGDCAAGAFCVDNPRFIFSSDMDPLGHLTVYLNGGMQWEGDLEKK